jgi:hypothetical protein
VLALGRDSIHIVQMPDQSQYSYIFGQRFRKISCQYCTTCVIHDGFTYKPAFFSRSFNCASETFRSLISQV